MVVKELLTVATLARVQARGGNMAAEFRAQRVWDSKQATYRRALQRHAASHWERFVAEAGRIDRIAKGRAPGDAWQVLERLLLVVADAKARPLVERGRSEEHTSELQSLMRISYAVFCLKKKKTNIKDIITENDMNHNA